MKVLAITNLFPNSLEPTRGTFNKQLIHELSAWNDIKVVAPVPWALPLRINRNWYRCSQVPAVEVIDNIDVYHPRYFMTPKIGRSWYGHMFYWSLCRFVSRLYSQFAFDIMFVPWVYPDGAGSVPIAQRLGVPIILQALGSDINIHTRYYLRRRKISRALAAADKVITVSDALKEKIVSFGIPTGKVLSVRNGINSELFKLYDQRACREELALPITAKIILFAGNLVPVKGIKFLIDAFSRLAAIRNDLRLAIVGDGPLKEVLQLQADDLRLHDRIIFAGRKPHHEISRWMGACDIFCLPSLNEGCPNVVLEALGCGKPVVASAVGGIPEILPETCGALVPPGDVAALERALDRVCSASWEPERVRADARVMSWRESAAQIQQVFQSTVSAGVPV